MRSNSYTKLAYRSFGNFTPVINSLFQEMRNDMKRADISLSTKEYASTALFSAVLTFIISAPVLSILTAVLSGGTTGIISGLILGLFIGLFLGSLVFIFFYLYPSIKISNRRKSIDNTLPFATMYLSTLAGTGTHPAVAFEMLGKFKEYGEVSKEARKIARDVFSFGTDLKMALERAAERTPSPKMKDLLWGINNVIASGGDFRAFLEERGEFLMADYMRDLDKFTNNLSIFIEIYITLVIVGSVFIMVLSALMGPIGLNPVLVMSIQMLEVFLFLPLAAALFILLIKTVSPVE